MENYKFYQKVKAMREMQKSYFRTRDKVYLSASKRLESEVDRMIHEVEAKGLF